jgi:exopolyphosphatase/guanosine-5'-triphosphate,3'-diphosphate pyrophosphatase
MFAAVDCGTNSIRLLVGDGVEAAERHMTITRLGRGTDRTGELSDTAIEASLEVLRTYADILGRYEIAGIRAVATSAARDASNREAFFGPARSIIGVDFELLSGQEEAELSYLGATAGLHRRLVNPLVVDIGGGSTEFAIMVEDSVRSVSIDVGCVRMTERFLHHDPPLPEELSAALSIIEQHLDDALIALPAISSAGELVGLAGTIVTMAAVEIGLPAYDRNATHGFVLTKAAAEDVFRTLATEALRDRIHNPGLEEQRADVIVGGCCVAVAILRRFGFAEYVVSESDMLDGLILSQSGGH